MQEQIIQLEFEIESLNEEIRRCELELENLRDQEYKLKEQIDKLHEKKLELNSIITDLQEKIATFEQRKKENEAQLQAMRSQLVQQVQERNAFQTQVNQANHQYENTR